MSRQAVLALLRAQEGEALSGEEIAGQLGLSRTAVWKAVDALRRQGYTIEARSGAGYRLQGVPDALSESEIRSFLPPTKVLGQTLFCFENLPSTNTYAKQLALSGGADGTVVIANCQTAGRGRMERSFQSPQDQGIYLTALLRPALPPERLLCVTALAGVAVCNAVETVCGVRPQLKWPNDPVLNGKKLCGILTELSLEGESGRVQSLVLGIGLNVLQTPADFLPELRQTATSLRQELSHPPSRPALAAALIAELDRLYAALRQGKTERYLEKYRKDCVNLGKQVQLLRPDGRETVTALDVDEFFGLVVRKADGSKETIRSGEVSVRGMSDYAE